MTHLPAGREEPRSQHRPGTGWARPGAVTLFVQGHVQEGREGLVSHAAEPLLCVHSALGGRPARV